MEKHWCFPLSARKLLELLSLARVRWWNYRQLPATLIWYHHHHYHHIYLVGCAFSCDIKLKTRKEIKRDFSKRNSKSTRTHRVSIFSVSPYPFHLLTVGTTPQVLPSVARLSSFLPYYLHMIFPDVICSDYLLSTLFHCNLVGSSSWIRSFVRWQLHDQGFLKCANPLSGKFVQGNMLQRRN